jgi:4-diphosphocytidyl-2-C-methyl-D-erythritol kinase
VRLKCYAKINLGLRVIGLRPDRYHELRTVFQTVSLFDTLEAWRARGPSRVVLQCNIGQIADSQNLAARAAADMAAQLKLSGTIHLRLHKRIPMGAGLGGGSSDAAAALRAVARLAGRGPDPACQLAMAAKLGADVPFFLLGGTALGLGRGTEVYALKDVSRSWLVLVHPPVQINTAQAYAALDQQRDARQVQENEKEKRGSPVLPLTESPETDKIYSFCARHWDYGRDCRRDWKRDRVGAPAVAWRDRLELVNDFEAVVLETYPQIARLKKQLIRTGAYPALLSGSGSAVYGLCESRRKAQHAGRELAARFPECRVWVLRTVSGSESLGSFGAR